MTDTQRDDIDAVSKRTIRELNAAIRQLADAEQLRQDTEKRLAQQRRARQGLGVLGRWAAGGVLGGPKEKKSPEEELEDARRNSIKMHRESVIWYLRRKLEEAGEVQRGMMEVRLEREMEKSKSMLYKTRGAKAGSMAGAESPTIGGMNGYEDGGMGGGRGRYRGGKAAQMEDADRREIEQQLSPEQLQLFAQENNEMLKLYEDQLDQVR